MQTKNQTFTSNKPLTLLVSDDARFTDYELQILKRLATTPGRVEVTQEAMPLLLVAVTKLSMINDTYFVQTLSEFVLNAINRGVGCCFAKDIDYQNETDRQKMNGMLIVTIK